MFTILCASFYIIHNFISKVQVPYVTFENLRDIIQLMKVKAHPSKTAKKGGMGQNQYGGAQ